VRQSKYKQFCDGFFLGMALPVMLCGFLAGWLAAAFVVGCRQAWGYWRKTYIPRTPSIMLGLKRSERT